MTLIHYSDFFDSDALLAMFASIGRPQFVDALMDTLNTQFGVHGIEIFTCRADECAVRAFSIGLPEVSSIEQISRVLEFDTSRLVTMWPLHQDTPVLLAMRAEMLCILAVHKVGEWDKQARQEFQSLAQAMMTAVQAHLCAVSKPQCRSRPTVSVIEDRFTFMYPNLSRREREVCARTVSGMTAEAISLDLSISMTTVSTYRRRAYHRLGICSAYELLGSLL